MIEGSAWTYFKKFILIGLVFCLAALVGGAYRMMIFSTFQKSRFETKILDRELVAAKLGGTTPQETWTKYLEALEQGDIETAVQYWWPEKRERIIEISKIRKEKGVLSRYAKNEGRTLTEIKNPERQIEQDEKIYKYKSNREKEIDYVGAEGEYKEFLDDFWKDQISNSVMDESEILFKLNKYSQKWLIKE